MAEKWQQWMPLDVNDWRGSPFVRALPAAARSGYLDLILAQWDSDDCSLSSDPLDLQEASFLTAAEWAEHGPRILRKFAVLESGRLRNQVCFEKWEKAKAMFYKTHKPAEEVTQARSEAGKRGNAKRWGSIANGSQLRSDLSQTDRKTSQTVHIQNKDKEQKPSRAPKARAADERHQACKAALRAYWDSRNPDVEMPWDGSEGKALGMFLSASPTVSPAKVTELLRNRYRSEVNHSDRPSLWLRSLLSYASGPIDRFGKPITGTSTVPKLQILSKPGGAA